MPSSLSRNHSIGSTVTINNKSTPDLQDSPSPLEEDEDFSSGDGGATSNARIAALQADLSDKTRYISTLEKRLLQARRSSQSRASLLVTPCGVGAVEEDPIDATALIKEKDAEIADLRARLEDKDRMVTALRSAARNRHRRSYPGLPIGESSTGSHLSTRIYPPPTSTSPTRRLAAEPNRHSNESGSSSHSAQAKSKKPVSPVQLLSPEKDKVGKRKSIDE